MRCRVLSKYSRSSDVVDAPGLLTNSGPGLAYVNLAGHIETIGENQVPNLRATGHFLDIHFQGVLTVLWQNSPIVLRYPSLP